MRVSELAARLAAEWEGEDLEVTGAAALEAAGPSDVAFVANRKAAEMALESRAGCLLVPREYPAGRTLIRVADPRGAFARVIGILFPRTAPPAGVHASAVVAGDAVVDSSASIGAGCFVGAGCRIGAECVLHPGVKLYDRVTLGQRVVLHSGCVIGADGFGFVMTEGRYEKFPQIGTVEIGDDVEIGANSCVDRAALGVTSIGAGTKIDNLVHVGHNCRIGRHVVIAAQTGFSGGVVVEDYAVIGGQVGIGDKARIESRAVLGSGCGILTSKIVRRGQVVWGTPARPLKEYLRQLAVMAKLPSLLERITTIEEELKIRR